MKHKHNGGDNVSPLKATAKDLIIYVMALKQAIPTAGRWEALVMFEFRL